MQGGGVSGMASLKVPAHFLHVNGYVTPVRMVETGKRFE